jgi:8-oxo-dGTP pyrophosphatase MutT (NUDIX family)
METLRNSTIVFLVKKTNGKIEEICLAMKKRGFGMNRWNGVGGKVNAGEETIEEGALRETKEEINVEAKNLTKVAELTFTFPHNPAWSQMVHVYTSEIWLGEPEESEEMKPKWYKQSEIPFKEMWPDDPFWLPFVLDGKLVKGSFSFADGDKILKKEVKVVNSFIVY